LVSNTRTALTGTSVLKATSTHSTGLTCGPGAQAPEMSPLRGYTRGVPIIVDGDQEPPKVLDASAPTGHRARSSSIGSVSGACCALRRAPCPVTSRSGPRARRSRRSSTSAEAVSRGRGGRGSAVAVTVGASQVDWLQKPQRMDSAPGVRSRVAPQLPQRVTVVSTGTA
jgi:hypothetical protein